MSKQLTPDQRAWNEYLAWARGATPREYVQTEALAWRRLQLALLPPAPEALEIIFVPEEGLPGIFTPEGEDEPPEPPRPYGYGMGGL